MYYHVMVLTAGQPDQPKYEYNLDEERLQEHVIVPFREGTEITLQGKGLHIDPKYVQLLKIVETEIPAREWIDARYAAKVSEGSSSQYHSGLLLDDVTKVLGLPLYPGDGSEEARNVRHAVHDALEDLKRMGLVSEHGPGVSRYKPTQQAYILHETETGLETNWAEIRREKLTQNQEEILYKLISIGQEEHDRYAMLADIDSGEFEKALGPQWTTYDGSIKADRVERELSDLGMIVKGTLSLKLTYKGIVWATRTGNDWREDWSVAKGTKTEAGGQGKVRKVINLTDGRMGAVKEIHEEHIRNKERRQRMVREVRALERLSGKGVPRVLTHNMEAVEDKTSPLYIIADWVTGTTLQQFTNGKALSVDDAISITRNLVEVVRQCHEQGVGHRDIKPDNIIINQDTKQLTLIDFGIAWVTPDPGDPEDFRTEAGQDLRNRFLTLPELANGYDRDEPRSDITYIMGILFSYSLAANQFSWLTGRVDRHMLFSALAFHQQQNQRGDGPKLKAF